MNLKLSYKVLLSLVLVVSLMGCNLPAGSGAGASVSLIEPANGAQYQVGDLVTIRSHIHATDGAAEVTVLVNGQPVRIDKPELSLQNGTMLQPWLPSEPGTYTIQTRMTTASGASLESDSVTIQVGAADIDPASPTPTSTAEPPTATPSPTLGPPIATADQDANCRFGPGQLYPVTGQLLTGQSSPIVGRNADSSWWVVQAEYEGGTCWIADSVVTIRGDTSGVAVVEAPPLPPPPAPTLISPSGSKSCTSTVFLEWNAVDHPAGIAYYEWEVQGSGGTETDTTTETEAEYFVSCGASYQWRVRAIDNNGTVGPYSDYMDFEIQ
jgi:hypothetical protein